MSLPDVIDSPCRAPTCRQCQEKNLLERWSGQQFFLGGAPVLAPPPHDVAWASALHRAMHSHVGGVKGGANCPEATPTVSPDMPPLPLRFAYARGSFWHHWSDRVCGLFLGTTHGSQQAEPSPLPVHSMRGCASFV